MNVNTIKLMYTVAVVLLLGLFCNQAMAYGAVAYSKQTGYTYTATEYGDSAAASMAALQGCSLKAKECILVLKDLTGDSVIAIAQGQDGAGFASNTVAKVAFNDALSSCREKHAGCTVTAIYWNPKIQYSAYAKYKDGDDLVAQTLSYGFLVEEDAKRAALDRCNKQIPTAGNKVCSLIWSDSENNKLVRVNNGEMTYTSVDNLKTMKELIDTVMIRCRQGNPKIASACQVVETIENPKISPKPKDFDAIYALTDAGKEELQKARSRTKPVAKSLNAKNTSTNYVTCSNKCINGSCVRTFPNGRTERWQAPRVYDVLSGDWKWDTSSCGK